MKKKVQDSMFNSALKILLCTKAAQAESVRIAALAGRFNTAVSASGGLTHREPGGTVFAKSLLTFAASARFRPSQQQVRVPV